MSYTLEKIILGNWGADRDDYSYSTWRGCVPWNLMKGCLIESWEIPDPVTMILHVRQGVRWQNIPPVNGREFTADDIVWNLDRYKEDPYFTDRAATDRIESVDATDKYTVLLKFKSPPYVGQAQALLDAQGNEMIPKECVGPDGVIDDWKKIIGTGPFILDSYVPDSAVTFIKNPDYWGYDELHPDNRLPYVDSVKALIIVDTSTKIAALRSGKIDRLYNISWQDAQSLKGSNPELKFAPWISEYGLVIRMNLNLEPWNNVKVRQAMQLALNTLEVAETLYHGAAEPYCSMIFPISPDIYTPFDELPPDIKELLSYNPERAKELLAQAGYSEGFKTHIDYYATQQWAPETCMLVQSYLADIGIEVELSAHETGEFNALRYGHQHTGLICHWNWLMAQPTDIFGFFSNPETVVNLACYTSPEFSELYEKMMTTFDDAERNEIIKELNFSCLRNSEYLTMPHPRVSVGWQPWLKGYSGEGALGMHNHGPLFARLWLDPDLKK